MYTRFDTKLGNGCYVHMVREVVGDENPDISYLDQPDFADRKEAYERGDFSFVGVRAVAQIMTIRNGTGTYTRIDSPGIWGIESDCGEEYLNETYRNEVAELREMLEGMGSPIYSIE